MFDRWTHRVTRGVRSVQTDPAMGLRQVDRPALERELLRLEEADRVRRQQERERERMAIMAERRAERLAQVRAEANRSLPGQPVRTPS